MDIQVELDDPALLGENISLELGAWEDLEYLVKLLNAASEAVEYRLEKVPHKRGLYLFIEDVLSDEDYACGIVEKHGKKAVAFSPAVHSMIMGAYSSYVEEYGDPMEA